MLLYSVTTTSLPFVSSWNPPTVCMVFLKEKTGLPTVGSLNHNTTVVLFPFQSSQTILDSCILTPPYDLAQNIQWSNSSYIRAPNRSEMEETVNRVIPCFQYVRSLYSLGLCGDWMICSSAAGMATGCQVDVQPYGQVFDLRQNKALGRVVLFLAIRM